MTYARGARSCAHSGHATNATNPHSSALGKGCMTKSNQGHSFLDNLLSTGGPAGPPGLNENASVRHRYGALRQILQQWHGVIRMLQIRDQVVRRTTGVSLNARILHNGLVKLDQGL